VLGLLAIAATLIALAAPASAEAASKRATVTVKTVAVGSTGNPSAAIVPFTDAIYPSCDDAPDTGGPACQEIGAVDYRYGIGQLEVTVKQYVGFLNTVDPTGKDPDDLYAGTESSTAWPKYGQINFRGKAAPGEHYRVAHPEWADKPYGFADFLRAARFVNSMYNGKLIAKGEGVSRGFPVTRYKVRLGREINRGMYDLRRDKRTGATRERKRGFVVPSQDEWVKAAYFEPGAGSYWKYPTNAGTFGDGESDAPAQSTLDPATGDVTNSATQPLATYHDTALPPPSWCPSSVQPQSDCSSVNPFGIDPTTYAKLFQGSLGTVGQAGTPSPWGTLDQGGNAVEWTDTITPPPSNRSRGRVWRRLHGGVPNSTAYQMWISAVGLQPQDNKFYNATYPWLGFRVGVVGDLRVGK
jgi:hypothetical protein